MRSCSLHITADDSIFCPPIPVAARSTALVHGHSLAGIAGSNTSGNSVFDTCECFVLSGRSLCEGADPSTRAVLTTVACMCVPS
jgi:hypothetical protein